MITLKQLSHTYTQNKKALDAVDIDIHCGKKTAIIGANGCGKSTLLYHLNCLYTPIEGTHYMDGEMLTKANANCVRLKTGLLFDNPNQQLFCPTVRDDIGFALKNTIHDPIRVEQKVIEIAEQLKITHLLDYFPNQLSLGQKKIVAIAGVLIYQPKYLLMDEPLSGLDPEMTEVFTELLHKFESLDCAQVIATHNLDFVYAWADNVIIMSEGKVIKEGDISILTDVDLLNSAKLKPPLLATLFHPHFKAVNTVEKAKQMIQCLIAQNFGGE